MFKKIFILAIALAIGVSPLIPNVNADSKWASAPVSVASWEYDLYKISRLSFDTNVKGPFSYSGAVFVTEPSSNCRSNSCAQVDATILKNGVSLKLLQVNSRISDALWHLSQNNRFVFYTQARKPDEWLVVQEYKPSTGTVAILGSLPKNKYDIKFMTFALDDNRLFASTMKKNSDNNQVETSLSWYDLITGFVRADVTERLTARWQEIVGAHNGSALVHFRFDGGYEQLWIVNERERWFKEVPNTWTAPDGDIIAPHMRSDGSIRFFKNFRLYTYKEGTDTTPREFGGANLNWFVQPEDAYQINGDRLAWVDSTNTLYVSDLKGVTNFGKALGGSFKLTNDKLFYQSIDGFTEFDFNSRSWTSHIFNVTDVFEDVLVGNDASGNIWYENTTTGRLLNIGFGSNSKLTDREHAIFRGADSNIYQVEFAALLDIEPAKVQAIKAYGEPDIYLLSDNKLYLVPDELHFLTWFDSFEDVTQINKATMSVYKELYENKGKAKFAPGTRVKEIGNPRVYTVGTDGLVHWIVTETVAHSIYGPRWNKGIIEVAPQILWRYKHGANIHKEQDVRTI